jgi:alpha-galactosidase
MDIKILNTTKELQVSLDPVFNENGIEVYNFSVKSETPIIPEPITLKWKIPAHNIKGVWKPNADFSKRIQADWELVHVESRVSIDAPIISLFGHDDSNALTFSCADAINKVEMNSRIREEDDFFYCHMTFFTEQFSPISEYSTEVRIDTNRIHFSKSLEAVAAWWETFSNLKPTHVPKIAKTPLYSTWYQFHQELDEEKLFKECEIAVDLGYKAIIIDDGWQTKDTNRGYDYTGDWKPDRITKTKQFVETIHQIGMKVGFWYSVPFCGVKSKAYKIFENKLLTKEHRWAPVLDPRFPEVRTYLIDIYKNALLDWNLDGLKLDFIDDFNVYEETVLSNAEGRDFDNVNEAVDKLLSDVITALKEINPDVFVEFRQKYVGPAMRKFGNMMRAFDCPGDATMNRVRIADIRMLAGNTAVHSDMITWHKEEKIEVAALQMVNTLFGVPQISIMLQDATDEQLKMIGFYTKYWNANSSVLVDGEFMPMNPLANYPIVSSHNNNHIVLGVYDDVIVDLDKDYSKLDIINGQLKKSIVLRIQESLGAYDYQVFNCLGENVENNSVNLTVGLHELQVPECGMIQFNHK